VFVFVIVCDTKVVMELPLLLQKIKPILLKFNQFFQDNRKDNFHYAESLSMLLVTL